jgi:putative NADH-flavin reductase
MKILSRGANGAAGQLALNDLLNANHEVTALAHNASSMNRKHPQLPVVQGEPTNTADLDRLLAGHDAVLSTLGARANKRTTLRAEVATNVTAGMKRHGLCKLVWLDAAGVGSSKEFVRRSSFFFGRIIMPIFLNHMYEDAAADELIEKGACDWVIVRPMSFTNRVKTGNVSVVTDMSLTVQLRLRITRADVAAFLVEQLVKDDYVGQMPIILCFVVSPSGRY